ncbi:otoferlin-like [Colias croceus]|uniref:otoferlin-like n=1 Tax=Colias crocea TaxID=72248 RepID=UPI001E28145D|nr:otoferlin-like [Colias croceus]
MLSQSAQLGRQKAVGPPTYRVENEYNPEAMPQYFQISVGIIEGRKFAWTNPHSANSYAIVIFGKKKYRTSIRRHMIEPYYNENFILDMYSSIQVLQRTNLWLAVMELRCCAAPRILGETTIDLGLIWSQPNHQVIHKWAQLYQPRDPSLGPVGFLKLNISIAFRGEIQVMSTVVKNEKLEENLLLPSGLEQQCANYQITIYEAFGLPCGTQSQGERRFGKPPSTFAKVTFCGLVAKTAVQHKTCNPVYSEHLSIVEMFPNMNRLIRIEVCTADGCFNKVLASTHLKLENISHDGENGFLPTFGPSLLHMYGSSNSGIIGTAGEEGPYHRGCLLVALNTIVPYYQQIIRSVNVEPANPINHESLWQIHEFCLFCPILEVSMLDRRVTGKYCGVAITLGEIPATSPADEEFITMLKETRIRKLHYTGCLNVNKIPPYGYLDFCNSFPVLQLATRLPDFRFRIYKNNMLQAIILDLDTAVKNIEHRLQSYDYETPNELLDELNKARNDAACNILKFMNFIQNSRSNESLFQQCNTKLDQKQLALQIEEVVQLHGWPDIVVWFLNEGSRVAYAKLPAETIIYSVIPEQRGRCCGRLQTLQMKPLKCPNHVNSTHCCCTAGKVEILMWLGSYRQRAVFDNYIPAGYKLKIKDYDMCLKSSAMMVECRAFVYKAKLLSSALGANPANTFLRVNILTASKETRTKKDTLTPIWNQVLKVHKMIFMSPERLTSCPPTATIEVNNIDAAGKVEVVGRFECECIVDDRQDYESAPRLQWYGLHRGIEYVGQVNMSIQLLQIPERLMKTTAYSSIEESIATGVKDLDLSDKIEPIPLNLIPVSTTYKVDVYWWGLRDVNITRKPCVILEIDDMTLKSEVIVDKKANCNFPNGRVSQTFEAPMHEAYSPLLKIRLYDSSTFGRTLYLGTNVVKNLNKYIVDWLPKNERDASLHRASIMSSDFVQVNQSLVLKRTSQLRNELSQNDNKLLSSVDCISDWQTRRSAWNCNCFRGEPDEEEYTLLPLMTSKNKTYLTKSSSTEQKDWWTRYLYSQEDSGCNDPEDIDRLTIYDSELERQPQFSKFRDWCATLKLYNGKKSGIREKDEQMYCGLLKAGLAIYRWPPPDNTDAVSPSGVDLKKGYFDDHPKNDPAKFLVRVYIIRAMNLKTKELTGKSDPYTVVSCGKKHFGDRSNYIPNTLNPVFGKMYELRCNLPEDYLVTVSLYDYDAIPPDELIGFTTIDLEDRIYSKHRARVGLASEFRLSEPFKWRDSYKPSKILEELCLKNHIPPPIFPDASTVLVNGVKYVDNSQQDRSYVSSIERRENLCLSILHQWHTIPVCGYYLVPEHVETRVLYKEDKPGVCQGALHMWVDIFPLDCETSIPPAVDITPRSVDEFELRLTILTLRGVDEWSCSENLELYSKVWIGTSDTTQDSGVYRPYGNGVWKLNYRMIFPLIYQQAERKLLRKEIGPFTEYEERISPTLVIQLMNNQDPINDCIGTLQFNLNEMPRGWTNYSNCSIENDEKSSKIDLFAAGCARGWWPLRGEDNIGNTKQTGIIELEMDLLPMEKAILMPIGVGRKPTFALPKRR